ncbi:simple sugar transport system permease protein [Sedimentibacter acidaminivorans]|uniref:Simple sugar transport system permease protein n=1 Tax=Sedimentibacter acidaminivorans TaxID=913099 RepID=A0ABS4GEA3_9FIRM|nr:ABC transporter permease [Sedimentibacter acidaminivorans]MBP1926033.1 simple sugar transport system permease protein [Sedimentibacter acidaminivorans]
MNNINNKSKQPLMRTVKRAERSKMDILKLRIIAFVLALFAGGLFILLIGYNPAQLYGTIISGAFRSEMAIQATIKFMIPLLISALGITLAFKMKFWNIGAEGQIIMGAIFASYFALFHSNWPHFLLLLVMFVAGFIGGGLWGLIPAYFKSRFNTNETLFTLMLNYIALHVISFLRDGPWKDPGSSGFPKIARFNANAHIDKIFGVQFGWIIALILVVVLFIYIRNTKQGYEINVVGVSQATAKYSGMNVKKIILRTMILSGGICGITGMIQATGSDMTLAASVAGGVGFTAIIVAWLANLNPFGILMVSFLFSVLEKGSSVMQSTYGLSTYSASVLQGIILFFILGCEFYIRYKFVFRSKGGVK